MIIHINRRQPSRSDIKRLSRHIKDDLPVVLPTETQYALACDATSKRAIDAVRAIKGRKPTAPFSIFLPGIESLGEWRIQCPEYARLLASRYLPGPLTLVLPTSNPLFKLLGGDGKSVGVRVTPEPVMSKILEATQKPLVATSANPSGVILTVRSENRWIGGLAEAGCLAWAKPSRYIRRPASTIIDCTGKVPRELRSGPIAKAEWNDLLSKSV